VRVGAVAVNRLDIWVREDVGHAYAARLPVIPGYDVGGAVAAVGEGVSDVAVGAAVYVHYDYSCGRCAYCLEGDEAACAGYEVMGVQRDGGYAELVLAPARNVFPLPDGLDARVAAAAGSVYLTAYHMLFARAGLRPGETVLVTAGGSGVGGAAIALARMAGARVIATASTPPSRGRWRRSRTAAASCCAAHRPGRRRRSTWSTCSPARCRSSARATAAAASFTRCSGCWPRAGSPRRRSRRSSRWSAPPTPRPCSPPATTTAACC
jgi:NADPH:quinone reductase-like Zn-dependent oxidoreductase